MNQIANFWHSVREMEQQLITDGVGEFVYVVSISTPRRTTYPGHVTHASRYDAAVLLTKQTHRLASDAEIAARKTDEEQQRQKIDDAEARREGRLAVPMPHVTGANKNG